MVHERPVVAFLVMYVVPERLVVEGARSERNRVARPRALAGDDLGRRRRTTAAVVAVRTTTDVRAPLATRKTLCARVAFGTSLAVRARTTVCPRTTVRIRVAVRVGPVAAVAPSAPASEPSSCVPSLFPAAPVSVPSPCGAGQAVPVTEQTADWMPSAMRPPRPPTDSAMMIAATTATSPAYSTAVWPSSRRQRIILARLNARRSSLSWRTISNHSRDGARRISTTTATGIAACVMPRRSPCDSVLNDNHTIHACTAISARLVHTPPCHRRRPGRPRPRWAASRTPGSRRSPRSSTTPPTAR